MMNNKYKTLTGYLNLCGVEFTFFFDGSVLRMILPNGTQKTAYQIFADESFDGFFIESGPIVLKEEYLVGISNETNSEVIFIPSHKGIIIIDCMVMVRIKSFVIKRNQFSLVNGVVITGPELNYIYRTNSAYTIEQIGVDGVWTVSTEPFYSTESETRTFIFEGNHVDIHFSINRVVNSHGNNPLDFNSAIVFSFNETDDILFVMRLVHLARKFIRFLCHRNDVFFDSMRILGYTSPNERQYVADIFIMDMDAHSGDDVMRMGCFIPFEKISGFENIILKEISDNRLYIWHIPESYELGRIMDVSRFISIVSAFEWEFRNLYPNGIEHSKQWKKVVEETLTSLWIAMDTGSSKSRKMIKHMMKHIGDLSLKSKIAYVCKDLNNIIDPYAEQLCRMNNIEWNSEEAWEKLNIQRNNFVHGNMDKDLIRESNVYILILERLILAIQMKRIGIPDHKIKDSIGQLFRLTI